MSAGWMREDGRGTHRHRRTGYRAMPGNGLGCRPAGADDASWLDALDHVPSTRRFFRSVLGESSGRQRLPAGAVLRHSRCTSVPFSNLAPWRGRGAPFARGTGCIRVSSIGRASSRAHVSRRARAQRPSQTTCHAWQSLWLPALVRALADASAIAAPCVMTQTSHGG